MQLINGYKIYTTELPNHFLVSSKSSTTLHHVVLPTDASTPICDCEWYVHTLFKQHVCAHVEAISQYSSCACPQCDGDACTRCDMYTDGGCVS